MISSITQRVASPQLLCYSQNYTQGADKTIGGYKGTHQARLLHHHKGGVALRTRESSQSDVCCTNAHVFSAALSAAPYILSLAQRQASSETLAAGRDWLVRLLNSTRSGELCSNACCNCSRPLHTWMLADVAAASEVWPCMSHLI